MNATGNEDNSKKNVCKLVMGEHSEAMLENEGICLKGDHCSRAGNGSLAG